MKKQIFSPALAATATAAVLSLALAPAPVAEASANTQSGTQCRAANLNQAFDLAWNHVRVHNEASVNRWIICPVNIFPQIYDLGGGETIYGPAAGDTYAWFGTGSAPSAEVYCIWREIPHGTTGTSVTNVVSTTLTADAPLPDTKGSTVDISAFGWYFPATMTCRLAPGTGINSYQVDYSDDTI